MNKQPLAFANKILSEVQRLSQNILVLLQKHHKESNATPKSENPSNKQDSPSLPMGRIFHLIERVRIERKASERKQEHYQRRTFIVTVVGLGVLIIYTIFTGFQSCATKNAADAAKSAADTASKTLHISERAYLILGPPIDDFPHKRINISIVNSGHIPSGPATLVIHEATFKIADLSARFVPTNAVIEKHWRQNAYESVPTSPQSGLFQAEVHLPAIIEGQLTSGKQGIIIAAIMSYNDGFPETPDQVTLFCDASSYTVSTKFFSMRPCDNPSFALQWLTSLDKYPSLEYEEK